MTLDVTIGGSAADSYITVAEADAYAFDDLGHAAGFWLSADVAKKEAALRRSTREIDAYVAPTVPYADTQSLAFPRASDVVSGAAVLPEKLRHATYLQAAYVLRNADIIDEAASRRARGLVNFANPDGTGGQVSTDPDNAIHPHVPTLLRGLADESSGVFVIETT